MDNFFESLNPGKGIPFMDDADKGNNADLLGKRWHIADFGFIEGDNGEFPVVQFSEQPEKFYFLNSVIGEMLHKVESAGMRSKLQQHVITFEMRTSKKDREYMTFEFVGKDGEEIPF